MGVAALTASDRMITAGDIQYEPQQLKLAYITPTCLVLIAGDYSLHSQAIKKTMEAFLAKPDAKPHDVAMTYGAAVQAVKCREAESLYLAPLGLNTDSFIAQQREMSESITATLLGQLQGYKGEEVSALVVGIEKGGAQLYTVDTYGLIGSLIDVGFGAIGAGAWHAQSQLMQAGYVNTWHLAPALASVFVAKKAAETAPGVGKNTDIHILTRDGSFLLWPHVDKKLHALYDEYMDRRRELGAKAVAELQEFIIDPKNNPDAADGKPIGDGNGEPPGSGDPEGSENATKGAE